MAEIKWKTAEEIEQEKNKPLSPTIEERMKAAEEALMALLLENKNGGDL